jgi:hypothetical protein
VVARLEAVDPELEPWLLGDVSEAITATSRAIDDLLDYNDLRSSEQEALVALVAPRLAAIQKDVAGRIADALVEAATIFAEGYPEAPLHHHEEGD